MTQCVCTSARWVVLNCCHERAKIAIAKRIEAGREMMIGGIVDSPMTIRALLQWRDALDEELMLLRDIIDLDATYSGHSRGRYRWKKDRRGWIPDSGPQAVAFKDQEAKPEEKSSGKSIF